jgi:prostamide/prostaglandin F2alpha synthase
MFGASSRRQSNVPSVTADALTDIVLPDHDGNDVRLGGLWDGQPAALVWLRHYG